MSEHQFIARTPFNNSHEVLKTLLEKAEAQHADKIAQEQSQREERIEANRDFLRALSGKRANK